MIKNIYILIRLLLMKKVQSVISLSRKAISRGHVFILYFKAYIEILPAGFEQVSNYTVEYIKQECW